MKVLILTEGLKSTGYGHLTRCLALYQAFEEKGIIPTYIVNCDENGQQYIKDSNYIVFDWIREEKQLYKMIDIADVVIIDSYLAPFELYNNISTTTKKAAFIDDYIRISYPKGIIINGTIGAEKMKYPMDDDHEYLLGVEYIPLRKEFWDVPIKQKSAELKNILLTFGVQDIKALTFPILTNLVEKYSGLNYHVILGKNDYDKEITLSKNKKVSFYYQLSATEMLHLMQDCDLAISAAGQTSYELNRVGLSSILIGVTNNQKYNLSGWEEIGYIYQQLWYNNRKLFEEIDNDLQRYMLHTRNTNNYQNSSNVDGQGARRISSYLLN